MEEPNPIVRRDLEFFPVQHQGQQVILVQDHLGLSPEGKALPLPLYQLMVLLDGTRSVTDLQTEIMRQKGGVLVSRDEIQTVLSHLDSSFLLDSARFRQARHEVIARFSEQSVRPCSHCGRSYPGTAEELRTRLGEILAIPTSMPEIQAPIQAIVSPHIDLSVGQETYANAYQMIRNTAPSRVIILGVGHRMMTDLFSLTEKDHETPLGVLKTETKSVRQLREAGGGMIAENDFAHRSEHSIEFQVLFLQHLFAHSPPQIVPILCGSLQSGLKEYTRDAYVEKTGPFLKTLRQILVDEEEKTLLIAGVDFSHIGLKFGHEMPANHLQNEAVEHDRNLLGHLSRIRPDAFWEESIRVKDRFNVCGFAALACLLEILPPCRGEVLHYQMWHEAATRSAVSFSAVAFAAQT
jgi:AmmeMemoRadiSam system protein B